MNHETFASTKNITPRIAHSQGQYHRDPVVGPDDMCGQKDGFIMQYRDIENLSKDRPFVLITGKHGFPAVTGPPVQLDM